VSMLARGDSGLSRMQAEAKRAEALEQHVHTAVAEGSQYLADDLSSLQQALPHDLDGRHAPPPFPALTSNPTILKPPCATQP